MFILKKINQLLLLFAFIILTGCSQRELTFDRVYPNLAIVEDFREKRQLEIEEEIKNGPQTILETRPQPRSLIIYDPRKKNNTEKRQLGQKELPQVAQASQYCWELNYLECDERMKPVHPYDSSEIDLPIIVLDRKYFEVSIDTYRGVIIPFPTRIEAYIYDQNKNLQLYQAFEPKAENQPFIFPLTLPSESKSFIFQFKVYYTGDIQGVTYHPIMIFTK